MRRQRPTRIISIDYGLARIGVAYSDERKIICSPLTTVATEKKLENTVEKLLKALEAHSQENRYEIEEIIVGLPLMMNGTVGLIADEVHLFVDLLRKSCHYPVKTWDERLTSVQADRFLREADMSRKKRAKHVDKVSAVIILQSYLDSRPITPTE